jgi:hypothetical protein
MPSPIATFINNPQSFFTSLTIFIPGIIAFLTFRSLIDFEDKKIRGFDLIAIALFSLLMVKFETISTFSGVKADIVYFVIAPILLGGFADLIYRWWSVYIVLGHKDKYLPKISNMPILTRITSKLESFDTADVSRWIALNREFAGNHRPLETWNYTEVRTGAHKICGFLVGYSKKDVELVTWEDLPESISGYKTNEDSLVRKSIVVQRDKIESLEIYDYQLEDHDII